MCHWNEMYCETYLSEQSNTQTVISLKPWDQDELLDEWDRYNMK